MVIICPECSTKFRVKAERIPDAGAKVRCARCKHVFLVQKPIEEEPLIIAPPISELPTEEPPPTVEPSPVPDYEQTSEPVPVPEPVTEPIPEPVANNEAEDFSAEPEENGFSYDQFRELDTDKDDDFTFGAAEEEDEQISAPPVVEEPEQATEESFSFSGPADEPVASEPEPVENDDELKLPEHGKSMSEEEITSIFADDAPESSATETAVPPHQPPAQPVAQKSGPTSSIIRVLLLLILGLAIIAGALYYVNGPEQIEQVIQQLFGQHIQPGAEGRISLDELEGTFVNNQEAGELFVIRGAATNYYREPRASIQVKGIIFDQNGKPLLQKTIFCGNPITDQELQTLPFSKLEEMMRNQFGKAMDNMKVNNKETIPFVIAFRDLPKNLSEFSVDIASSEPAVQ